MHLKLSCLFAFCITVFGSSTVQAAEPVPASDHDLVIYGGTSPFSQLAWVDRKGKVMHFNSTRFEWKTEQTWTSPATGAEYPVQAHITTTDPATNQRVAFTLKPLMLEQELTGRLGGIAYWEGACRVLNEKGEDVGSAYMELAGYVGRLADRFK